MQKHIFALCLFIIFVLLPPPDVPAAEVNRSGSLQGRVYFSPGGGCTDAVLAALSRARAEILIQAYSFHSPSLARALIGAHKRGVKVEVILDKSERQEGFTPATEMANAGIPIFLDGIHAVANNRIIVIDRSTVLTGSFNFNKASEEMNAENLVILPGEDLAGQYRENWLLHRKHSEPF